MEDQSTPIETLLGKTEQYVMSSAEVYRLKLISKSADVVSALTVRLVLIVFLTLFFITANIGVALWLGELLGKTYYGFFSVSGFYVIAGLLFFTFRKSWIKSPVQNAIINQALN